MLCDSGGLLQASTAQKRGANIDHQVDECNMHFTFWTEWFSSQSRGHREKIQL